MPLPKPKSGESQTDFIDRCMSDGVMVSEYTEAPASQRRAICQTQWDKRLSLGSMSLELGSLKIDVRPDGCGAFATITAATVTDGQPRQRFRKELIRTGQYIKASSNQEFTITPEVLQHWSRTFGKMSKNGVKVPIPSTHAGAGDPDKNRGWVEQVFVEGDSLVMVCELIGDDAIKAAARNDVSIHSPPEFTDDKGNVYQQPIAHVALTPEPLVSGLSSFISIAASRRLENIDMTWKETLKLLDIEVGDLTAETAEPKITAAIKELKKKAAAKPPVSASHGDGGNENDGEGKGKGKSKGKEGGKEDAPSPVITPMMISLARDNRGLQLDAALRAGRIDKATRDKLEERYASDDALTLALSNLQGVDEFDYTMKILAANKPVRLGEGTGAQTITMGDANKGDEANVLIADAEARAKEANVA